MKIFVDERPKQPEHCPFSIRYYCVCTCKLGELESLICKDTVDCLYLKVLEEEE